MNPNGNWIKFGSATARGNTVSFNSPSLSNTILVLNQINTSLITPHWVKAGYLTRIVNLGGRIIEADTDLIKINMYQLFRYDDLGGNYVFKFTPVEYIDNVSINVYYWEEIV